MRCEGMVVGTSPSSSAPASPPIEPVMMIRPTPASFTPSVSSANTGSSVMKPTFVTDATLMSRSRILTDGSLRKMLNPSRHSTNRLRIERAGENDRVSWLGSSGVR